MDFAERLKEIRMSKDLSQQQLADMVFVDRSSVARWESGTRMPDAVMIARLSKCLDVDVSELLDGTEEDSGLVVILWCIYFLLLLITQFTDSIYVISDENMYSRGPLYFLLLIPMVCILTQMFSYGLLMIVIGTSIASLFMFGYLMMDIAAEQIQQYEENAEQNALPHFHIIWNVTARRRLVLQAPLSPNLFFSI